MEENACSDQAVSECPGPPVARVSGAGKSRKSGPVHEAAASSERAKEEKITFSAFGELPGQKGIKHGKHLDAVKQ